jgi:hypothetical protein
MEGQANARNLVATAILDYTHTEVQSVLAHIGQSKPSPCDFVRMAHTHISDVMRPIYSIEETMPVSKLLRTNAGSCSQRMACVEAFSRGYGIPTRVRALWLDKSFWYYRLPLLRPVMPKRTLMPWPQFYLEDRWVDFDEIYSTIAVLAEKSDHAFTNAGESLFDAVQHEPVDLLGKSAGLNAAKFSLTKFVVGDGGFYDTRDDLLAKLDNQRTWIGKRIFNLTYGGRPVRRMPSSQ